MAYQDPYSSGRDAAFQPYASGGEGYNARASYASSEKLPLPPKGTGLVGQWRKQDKGRVFTRGGGLRTFGRSCACFTMFFLCILITAILALVLYVKPPNVTLNQVQVGAVAANTSSLSVGFSVSLSLSNPNYFNFNFQQITAEAFYPINGAKTKVGGGSVHDIAFNSGTKTTFSFPFNVEYTPTLDPNNSIIQDIVSRCGFITPSSKRDLAIDYTLKVKIKVLTFSISPSFSDTANFACPFSLADISKLGIAGLSGITT